MIVMIAAVAENNALGKDNTLLWHLPKDFKRFKEITSGHYIIMGRKTFDSFPKPLPNRTHIIISRQEKTSSESCIIAKNLEEALAACPKDKDIFIIGGGEIYKQSLHLVDQLDITRVHHSFEADTYFPEIDPEIWKLTSEIFNQRDEKHLFDYTFQTFARKNKTV